MPRVRIGAVSYLNARPLVSGLERGPAADSVELSYEVPSVLADRMAAGDLDLGLLPVVELARMPDLEIVPGLSIASRGPARSVLLVGRRPPEAARRVALDPESRTTNALVRVLFAEVWNASPAFGGVGPDLDADPGGFDSTVRIGDKALFEPLPPEAHVIDLGRAWTEATGLPFVYAVWAARPGVLDRELYRALHDSRRSGVRRIDLIAEEFAWNGRRDPRMARAYLKENIVYRLGADEVRGMRQFLEAAARHGVIEAAPELRMGFEGRTRCDELAESRRAPR